MTSLPSSPVDHPCPEYQTVQSMYSTLCTGLQINLLIPNLISGSVIDFTEREEILAEATERKRTEKLLEYMMKQLSANCCDRFNRFMDVMGRSSNCSFLAKKMKEHLAYYRSQATTQPGICPSVCLLVCVLVWVPGVNWGQTTAVHVSCNSDGTPNVHTFTCEALYMYKYWS